MKYISHRGNLNGKILEKENSPDYILEALNKGYDVEIDIWYNNGWYLGHDEPVYKIEIDFFKDNFEKIWFHCKNLNAIVMFKNIENNFKSVQYFWHQNDSFTLTSNNYIWTYPGEILSKYSICILTENINISENYKNCYGICSDNINEIKLNSY